MKIGLNFFLIFLISFLFINIANATVFTSIDGGDFNSPDTWDVGDGKTPGAMDDVVIKHEVYLNLTSKKTIKSLSISNIGNRKSWFEIYGTDSLVVLNNVQATAHNIDKVAYLWVGGFATVIIEGNCHFLRVAENEFLKFFDFSIVNNAKVFIKGSLRFDYLGADSYEENKEIYLRGNALLDVEGKTVFTNSGGEDFNFVMYNQSEAIFRDSLTLILNGTGKEAAITLHDSTSLQIFSSAYLFNSSTASNDFAKLRAREEASSIYVQDNVYMESYAAKVKLMAEESGGTITVGGDIVMNASGQEQISVNIIDQGKLYLGGDIVRPTNFGRLTIPIPYFSKKSFYRILPPNRLC